MLNLYSGLLGDWLEKTSYTHVLSPYQRIDLWKADLKEYPPVLDLSLDRGPRTFLYDVCHDPFEATNLVGTPQGRALAAELFVEFMKELEGSVSEQAPPMCV